MKCFSAIALISCLPLLSLGCSSGKTLATLDTSDKDRTIIVCTTDSLFYRFPAYEWSVDENGDIGGRARSYPTLEDAEHADNAAGPVVTIPAEKVASCYEPGSMTTVGGVSLLLLIVLGSALIVFLAGFSFG